MLRFKDSTALMRPLVKLPYLRLKRKVTLLAALVLLVLLVQLLLPGSPALVQAYSQYVFRPWQTLRNRTIGAIPFSVGDVLYLLGGLAIVIAVIRWSYFAVKFRTYRSVLGHSLLSTVNILAVVYLLFFIGWGGNYYKPKLSEHWNLEMHAGPRDSLLMRYDAFLVTKLNALAPVYKPTTFSEAEKSAENFYRKFTDSRTKLHGLNTKPSAFGYFMQYLGVQGYYNPWTGEAQVNRLLPSFMLPFVACHEMAHQSGIAAEDDANLLAYALCTTAPHPSFAYSGYFNLWLYTHGRLRRLDSALANTLETTVHPLVLSQRDTLREIRRRYRSEAGNFSAQFYDGYLRLHNQKEGLDSYGEVAVTAWAFEQKRKEMRVLRIP